MNLKTISVSEAANMVNLPRQAIYKLLASGQIAGARNGRDHRVNEASLIEWATRRNTPSPIAVPQQHDPENPFV